MDTRRVSTATVTLNVLDQGSGPAVLLCHGFPETARSWRHQIRTLAGAGFRAIAPDMRGYGGSDGPEAVEAYNVLEVVGDLVALLDTLDVPTALIVGNDWGATVAWQAVRMRPDRFVGIVALGVPFMERGPQRPTEMFPSSREAQFYTLYFQPEERADMELDRDPRRTLLKIIWGASGDVDAGANPFAMVSRERGMLDPLPEYEHPPEWLGDEEFDALVAAFGSSGFRGGLNYYRNLDRNWSLQSGFSGLRVSVPALFMAGERDPGLKMPGMSEIIDAMRGMVDQLKPIQIIPEAGHWLPQQSARTVSDRLIAFARELCGGGRAEQDAARFQGHPHR